MSLPEIVFTLIDTSSPGAALDRAVATITPGVDFALDDNGDLIIPKRFTTGVEAVAQGVRIRILTVKKEWFADLDAGMDWYGEILGEKFNQKKIREAFYKEILKAPYVLDIVSLTATFDGSARRLTINGEILSAFGVVSVEVT